MMPNYDSLKRLKALFRELFQLDTADLDFGLYRLFRLKRAEIETFLDKQLPAEVEKAFASVTGAERETLKKQVEELARQARESVADDAVLPTGQPNPKFAGTKAVKEYAEACRRVETAEISEGQRAEVFNQLYAFFSRYYDDGDFIPRRFFGAHAAYAVPYNGEEVFFHWANKDQYYVKSGEAFRDYAFTVPTLHGEYRVRFRLDEATTPRDNAKGDTRFFFPRPKDAAFDDATLTFTLPFEYRLPVASAQVKSAILLAGLASSCSVTVREDVLSRDHTERMIQSLGEGLTVRNVSPVIVPDPNDPRKKRREMPESFKREVVLSNRARINGGTVDIPGDFSTAAFFLAVAAISKNTITVENVGLNPTRTGFLEYLRLIGCTVETANKSTIGGEPRGAVAVTGGQLRARKVSGETVVGLLDELPVVAVIAAFADGTSIIRGASELKVKESDRLTAIADNLKRMGVKCGLLDDGLVIEGGKDLSGADFQAFGDHRIAMAFSVASLFLVGPSTIDDHSVVAVSCPDFYDLLNSISL